MSNYHLKFAPRGWEDYSSVTQNDAALRKRLNKIFADIMRNPYEGIGKPEPLKHELSSSWSRRIDDKHRLVYEVCGEDIVIQQCRHHY